MWKVDAPESVVSYSRVLGTLRRSIYQDYKRLRKKRLTPSDCIIVMIRKYILLAGPAESEEYRMTKEYGTVEKVICKMWENIRNKSKHDGFVDTQELIIKLLTKKKDMSAFECDSLSLVNLEYPKPKEITMTAGETLINRESSRKLKEVTLRDNDKEIDLTKKTN